MELEEGVDCVDGVGRSRGRIDSRCGNLEGKKRDGGHDVLFRAVAVSGAGHGNRTERAYGSGGGICGGSQEKCDRVVGGGCRGSEQFAEYRGSRFSILVARWE